MVHRLYSDHTEYYASLLKILESGSTTGQIYKNIVNAPFSDKLRSTILGLGVVVLLLVNKKERTIDRVALSDTDQAAGAVRMSVKPFRSIRIPLDDKVNLIAKAIRTNHPQLTSDWQYLFTPELKPEEARLNQAGAGIGCSFVYPLDGLRDGGALIFSYYMMVEEVGSEQREFMQKYSNLVSKTLK